MGSDRLGDRQEIHDTLMRYCRGIDRGDAELVLSCYHPGAVEDHGSFFGSATDFVAVACQPAFDAYDSMMHCITNELVEFEGPTDAHSEAYFVVYMRRHQSGQGLLETMGGRYVDELQRRGDEWRITHRVAVFEWGDTRTLVGGFPPNVDVFEQGRRFDSDIAYTRVTSRPGRGAPSTN